ncbi:MAG: Ig-like domain-containing protein [Bryobacteraceae bacterium]|nr:Ig-like domain-containing protein [Bryobacteraceae bacterium]
MRLALGFLSAVTCLAQVNPASIQIVSDTDQVLVGRSVQMRAVVRDAQGNPRTGDPVLWTVNNRAIAEVSSQGEVRAVGLGIVRVSAQVGTVRVEAPIQTMPREVTISPGSSTLDINATQQFRATALDADGAVINGVTFTWAVTNKNGGGTSLVTVTTTGMLTARAEGGALVRATYTYNENVTGMQRQWLAMAPVDVAMPRTYEVTRVINTREKIQRSFELRARPSMLWGTDDGQLFFNATLDGLSNGLVHWNYGDWKMVAAGGTPRFTGGSFVQDLRIHTITSGGQIMALEETNGNGNQLSRGDRTGLQPFLTVNAPLAGTEGANGIFVSRNSYTPSGWVMVRATFRFPGTTTTLTGLFRGFGERITELLAHSGETLPGFTGALNLEGDFGITDDGVAYYAISAGAQRTIFRHQDAREKLITINDPLAGSTVRRFLGGRANAPTFFVSERGDVLCSVELNDNTQHFVRYTKAGGATPQTLRQNSVTGILWHNSDAGTLFFGNPFNNQGSGIYIWPTGGGNLRSLLVPGRTQVAAQAVQDVESGFLAPNGEATLMIRGASSNMLVVRMLEEPWVIAQHGDRINIDAPWNMINFVGGARQGPAHLLTGGTASTVAVADRDTLRPVVTYGERLYGTQMFFGSSVNNSNWNARKAPNGDLYFTHGLGLGRVAAGSTNIEMFLRFPLTIDGLTISAPFWVDANSRGDVFWTSFANSGGGENRLYVTRDGQHRFLLAYSATSTTATTLEGRIVSNVSSYTLDDDGRLMASMQFRNQPDNTIYLWNGQTWQFLARQNETRIGGQVITSISNYMRAGGNRLFSMFQVAGARNIIAEWRGSAWEAVLNDSQVLPHGQVVNSVSLFDVNRAGDIFFQHSAGTPFLMVRKGDRYLKVANLFQPTAASEYIIRVLGIDFRDDGTVFLLAINSEDEQVLYQARPL